MSVESAQWLVGLVLCQRYRWNPFLDCKSLAEGSNRKLAVREAVSAAADIWPEITGGRMTAPVAKSVWVNLYKQLEREAAKFPQYNIRVFAQRRIREHFEANRGVTDPAVQKELLKVG
ncbi:hypothetical protein ANCCAN_25039 [Ancylostoma caninum]|uniref:Complex 1 LYR protein domain-containing protein n=1 Tax=Ancylostoma caninum TaxID=29170 RepID=A0A368FGA5_ANCCA|nr:hypothetical protein ANCCAN_25039 [Ancylostoma caninum]